MLPWIDHSSYCFCGYTDTWIKLPDCIFLFILLNSSWKMLNTWKKHTASLPRTSVHQIIRSDLQMANQPDILPVFKEDINLIIFPCYNPLSFYSTKYIISKYLLLKLNKWNTYDSNFTSIQNDNFTFWVLDSVFNIK